MLTRAQIPASALLLAALTACGQASHATGDKASATTFPGFEQSGTSGPASQFWFRPTDITFVGGRYYIHALKTLPEGYTVFDVAADCQGLAQRMAGTQYHSDGTVGRAYPGDSGPVADSADLGLRAMLAKACAAAMADRRTSGKFSSASALNDQANSAVSSQAEQSAPPVPQVHIGVTDQMGALSPEQLDSLGSELGRFADVSGYKIAVLLVPTSGGEPVQEYAGRAIAAWQADDDRKLLVAVFKNDKTLRIEVGPGMRSVVPDAFAKAVIEKSIVPRFRQGDFYGGLRAGIGRLEAQILSRIPGEPKRVAKKA